MAKTREHVSKELRALATELNEAAMKLFTAAEHVGDDPENDLSAIYSSTASDLVHGMDYAIHKLRCKLSESYTDIAK